nr:MAG TPA: hypothetical protein [Caudoviricetes sp.]
MIYKQKQRISDRNFTERSKTKCSDETKCLNSCQTIHTNINV